MTELIWDGKYDKDGRKNAPVRISLPFQTIETVNESAQDRELTLELFSQGKATEWRNRLIWGDKKYVLPSLLAEFAGEVDLIYIDPPFDTGADFTFSTEIPGSETRFTKQPSIIEQKAYRDTWGKGQDSYLQWFYETVVLLHDFLAESGSIYVHCDYRVSSSIGLILDEIFGKENFQNEIIWHYYNVASVSRKCFGRKHDTIFFYAKGRKPRFNWDDMREAYSPNSNWVRVSDSYGDDRYGPNERGKLMHDVWRIPTINNMAKERVDYPTQKPKALLERIIKASSNEGDLVLDCFIGGGTTSAVAEGLNRRWIACDLGRFAIHTTRKRLLSVEGVKPFVVQNLGKYERQEWMSAEFRGGGGGNHQHAYRNFILELYHAIPMMGYAWLHGVRAGRMVHVGSVDAPVTIGDVKSVVTEFWKYAGKATDATTNGVDILGWDFGFELNEVATQIAAEANVDLKFKKIPREVLEKQAVEQGDIRFFELAALSVDLTVCERDEPHKTGSVVRLELTDFVIPPDDVPKDIQETITHWSQWIDYWAVDWDFRNDTFHNQWQSYRTKQEPDLQKEVTHTYENPGDYTVMAKVIDILGNDTTKAIEVNIK